MFIVQTPEQLNLAQQVLRFADIEFIQLIASEEQTVPDRHEYVSPFTVYIDDMSAHTVRFAGNKLEGDAKFTVSSTDTSEDKKLVFRVSCTFRVSYGIHETFVPSAEQSKAFLDCYAVFNAWPYVREFVHTTTQRMGISPPPLPFLRIDPPHHTETQQPTEMAKVQKKKGVLAKRKSR
jgi:preprotein translocase subunit SecB